MDSATQQAMESNPASSWREIRREIVWTGIGFPSLDYCRLTKRSPGWQFSGIMVAKLQGKRFGARYELLASETFAIRSCRIEKISPGREKVTMVEFRDAKWIVDGKHRVDLRECTDLDLEASPVTNTIPIRRYNLKLGEHVDLNVAWVRFPSLRVTRLKQSYERIGDGKYRYRSASGFTAIILVDNFGLVKRYGNVWKEAI